MTFDIDEATDFCKHKASNYKRMSVDAGSMDLKPEEAIFGEECKRYEQLSEWLEELKALREFVNKPFCENCIHWDDNFNCGVCYRNDKFEFNKNLLKKENDNA